MNTTDVKVARAIKNFRSKWFLVGVIFLTILALFTVLSYIVEGLGGRSILGHLVNLFVVIMSITGWERRYTAIHNPKKIYDEVTKNDK